jgi:putative FmdB family regulatory protein
MPIYEYKCGACGQIFELKQNFSDAPLTTHEGCGGAVKRLISAPALKFKGTGWYVTDYAKGGSGQKAGSGGDGGSKDSKTDNSKDSKTDKPKSSDSGPSSTSSSSSSSTETK